MPMFSLKLKLLSVNICYKAFPNMPFSNFIKKLFFFNLKNLLYYKLGSIQMNPMISYIV